MISFAGLNQQTTTEDFHKHTDEGPTREALEAHVVGVYERALRTQKHGDNKLALELYNEALMSKQMVGVDRKVLRNKDPRSHTMLWLKYLINKNIAQLCTTDGLFSHSLQYFFEATKIEDTDPVVWLNFSDAAARADDIGLAISCAQSALRAEQHCWPAIDRLCVLLFTAGDYNGCNEIIAYALALDPLYARGQELAKAISSDETQRIKHYWLREARTAGDAATERSDEIASELQIGPGRPNLASRISGSARSGASHKMTNSRVNRKRKGRSTSTVGGGMKRRPNLADRLREKRLKRAKQYIDSAHTYNTSVPTQTIVLNEATWGGVCDALLSAHRAVVMPTAEQSPSMGGAGHELNGDTMCVHPFLSVKFELSPALSALPKPPPELQPPIRPSNLDLTVNKDSAAPEARSSEPIAAPSKDEQKAEREKERAKEAAPKPKRSSRLAAVKEAAQEAPIAQSTKLDNEIIWEDLLPTFIADSLKVLPGLADLTPGSTRSTTPHVHSSTTGMSSRNASSVGVSKGVTGSDTRQPSIALPWKDAESQNEPYMGFGGKLEEVKSRLQSEVRVTGDQTDAIPLTGATSMNSIEPGSTVAVRTDVGADEGSGTGTHKSRTEPRSTLAADTKVTTDAQKVNNSHLSETETTTAAAVKMEAPAEGQRTEDPHASQSDSKTTVDGNTGVTTEGHAAIDTKQSMPESSTTMTEESTGLADRPTVADVKQTTDESSITMTEELTGLADRPTVADVKQTTDESSTTMTEESTGLADVKQTMPESSTTMTEESTGLADRPTVADVKQITDELSPKLASHTEVTAEEHSVADTKHSSVEHSITVAEIAGVTTEGQAVIDTRQAVAEVSTTATVDTATPADGKRDTDEDLRMDTDAKSPLDPDTDASMDTLSSVVTAESQESPPPLVYVEVANPFMDSPAAFDANSSGDTSPVLASHSADEDRAVRYTDTTRNSNPTLEKVRSIDTDSGMDTKMTTDTNPSLKCDGYIVQTSTPVGAATINTDVEVGPAKDSNCSDNTHTATDTESHIKDGTPCAPTVDTNLPTATDTHATEASEPVVDVVENGSALTIDADAGDGMETTPGVNKPEQAHQALHTTADAPTESQADAELEVEGVGDEAAISAHATGPVGVDKINDGEIVGDDSFSSDTGLNESFDMGNDLGMESASTKAGVTEEKEATATEVQSDEKPKIAVQQDDSTKALQATNVDTTKEGASGSSMVSEEKEEGLQVAGSSTDAQKGLGEANSVRVADESGSVGSASQAPNDSTLVGEGIRLGTETESNAQTIADTKKRSEAGEASDTEDGTPASKKTRLDSEIGDSKVSEKETTYAHGVSVDTTYSDASVKPLGDAGAPEGEIGTSMDIDIRMDTNSDNTQPRRPLATSDDHGHTQTVAGGQGAAENPPIAASDALDTAVSPKVKTCGKTVAENTSAATVETPNSVEVVQEVETDPLDIGTIGAEGRADSATARGDNLSGSGSTESKGSSQMNTRGLYQRAHEREDEVMVGTADVPESHTSKMNTEKSSDVEKCEMKTKEERDPGIEIVDSYRKPKSPRAELCTHEFLAYQNNGDWLTTYLSTAFEARGNVDRIRCEVLARWGDTSASYELVGENGSSATLNHSTSCCTLGPPEGTPAALLQRQTPWSSLSNSARAALQARVIGLHDIVKVPCQLPCGPLVLNNGLIETAFSLRNVASCLFCAEIQMSVAEKASTVNNRSSTESSSKTAPAGLRNHRHILSMAARLGQISCPRTEARVFWFAMRYDLMFGTAEQAAASAETCRQILKILPTTQGNNLKTDAASTRATITLCHVSPHGLICEEAINDRRRHLEMIIADGKASKLLANGKYAVAAELLAPIVLVGETDDACMAQLPTSDEYLSADAIWKLAEMLCTAYVHLKDHMRQLRLLEALLCMAASHGLPDLFTNKDQQQLESPNKEESAGKAPATWCPRVEVVLRWMKECLLVIAQQPGDVLRARLVRVVKEIVSHSTQKQLPRAQHTHESSQMAQTAVIVLYLLCYGQARQNKDITTAQQRHGRKGKLLRTATSTTTAGESSGPNSQPMGASSKGAGTSFKVMRVILVAPDGTAEYADVRREKLVSGARTFLDTMHTVLGSTRQGCCHGNRGGAGRGAKNSEELFDFLEFVYEELKVLSPVDFDTHYVEPAEDEKSLLQVLFCLYGVKLEYKKWAPTEHNKHKPMTVSREAAIDIITRIAPLLHENKNMLDFFRHQCPDLMNVKYAEVTKKPPVAAQPNGTPGEPEAVAMEIDESAPANGDANTEGVDTAAPQVSAETTSDATNGLPLVWKLLFTSLLLDPELDNEMLQQERWRGECGYEYLQAQSLLVSRPQVFTQGLVTKILSHLSRDIQLAPKAFRSWALFGTICCNILYRAFYGERVWACADLVWLQSVALGALQILERALEIAQQSGVQLGSDDSSALDKIPCTDEIPDTVAVSRQLGRLQYILYDRRHVLLQRACGDSLQGELCAKIMDLHTCITRLRYNLSDNYQDTDAEQAWNRFLSAKAMRKRHRDFPQPGDNETYYLDEFMQVKESKVLEKLPQCREPAYAMLSTFTKMYLATVGSATSCKPYGPKHVCDHVLMLRHAATDISAAPLADDGLASAGTNQNHGNSAGSVDLPENARKGAESDGFRDETVLENVQSTGHSEEGAPPHENDTHTHSDTNPQPHPHTHTPTHTSTHVNKGASNSRSPQEQREERLEEILLYLILYGYGDGITAKFRAGTLSEADKREIDADVTETGHSDTEVHVVRVLLKRLAQLQSNKLYHKAVYRESLLLHYSKTHRNAEKALEKMEKIMLLDKKRWGVKTLLGDTTIWRVVESGEVRKDNPLICPLDEPKSTLIDRPGGHFSRREKYVDLYLRTAAEAHNAILLGSAFEQLSKMFTSFESARNTNFVKEKTGSGWLGVQGTFLMPDSLERLKNRALTLLIRILPGCIATLEQTFRECAQAKPQPLDNSRPVMAYIYAYACISDQERPAAVSPITRMEHIKDELEYKSEQYEAFVECLYLLYVLVCAHSLPDLPSAYRLMLERWAIACYTPIKDMRLDSIKQDIARTEAKRKYLRDARTYYRCKEEFEAYRVRLNLAPLPFVGKPLPVLTEPAVSIAVPVNQRFERLITPEEQLSHVISFTEKSLPDATKALVRHLASATPIDTTGTNSAYPIPQSGPTTTANSTGRNTSEPQSRKPVRHNLRNRDRIHLKRAHNADSANNAP